MHRNSADFRFFKNSNFVPIFSHSRMNVILKFELKIELTYYTAYFSMNTIQYCTAEQCQSVHCTVHRYMDVFHVFALLPQKRKGIAPSSPSTPTLSFESELRNFKGFKK